MAEKVFNIALGAAIEKMADANAKNILLLLEAAEADGTIIDHDDLAALLGAAGNTEATFTNYARKTGLTGTITTDDVNDRRDVDMPDQTFTTGSGNAVTDAIVAYEESAADSGRIPLTLHDAAFTPDGNDTTLVFNAAGFLRAQQV